MARFKCGWCGKQLSDPFSDKSKCPKHPKGIHEALENLSSIKKDIPLFTYWCRICKKNIKKPVRIDERNDPFEPIFVDTMKCPQCNNINCLEQEHYEH